MDAITIIDQKTDNENWHYTVSTGSSTHTVTVSRHYWEKLTGGAEEPAELVRRSIAFLLEREPASAILPAFNLSQIPQYFPEYETIITKITNA